MGDCNVHSGLPYERVDGCDMGGDYFRYRQHADRPDSQTRIAPADISDTWVVLNRDQLGALRAYGLAFARIQDDRLPVARMGIDARRRHHHDDRRYVGKRAAFTARTDGARLAAGKQANEVHARLFRETLWQ